jgi:hypothetical protein
MSYTNLDLVNKHINFEDFQAGTKKDYAFEFSDISWCNLPGRFIRENSLIVKSHTMTSPAYEEINLESAPVSLNRNYLIPQTMVVAANKSLSTIYRETIDYLVSYREGQITRIEGGGISAGTTVSAWYFYYTLYDENIDYEVEYSEGRIRLLTGSNIAYNQTILIDYDLSSSQLSEALISGAVAEANAIVESEIDPSRPYGADQTLQTAATFLAVSLLCRMAGTGNLTRGEPVRSNAEAWIKLADSYRTDYGRLIKKFRPNASRFSRPTHS